MGTCALRSVLACTGLAVQHSPSACLHVASLVDTGLAQPWTPLAIISATVHLHKA